MTNSRNFWLVWVTTKQKKGKTSGSHVAFVNQESKHIIRLHKPHPGNIVKSYALEQIYEELKSKGII